MHALSRAAVLAAIISISVLATPKSVEAQPDTTYRVTVTNLTQHQIFSYPIVGMWGRPAVASRNFLIASSSSFPSRFFRVTSWTASSVSIAVSSMVLSSS